MEKVAFVVLHYKTYHETIACVGSILSSQQDDVQIVIVDNGSNDGSAAIIENEYCHHPKVHFISSQINLGFACGMNLGIQELKKSGWRGFVVLLNNDTVISQSGWTKIINLKYDQYRFGVLGPDIINLDGSHCNPFYHVEMTAKSISKQIICYQKMYLSLLCYVHPLISMIRTFFEKKRRKNVSVPASQSDDTVYDNKDIVNVSLQGSCLILSPLYFEYYDGLYDKTFLYYEEAVLNFRCKMANIPSVYSPELTILHEENAATNTINKNKRKRLLFVYRNSIGSLKNIKRDIKQYETTKTIF